MTSASQRDALVLDLLRQHPEGLTVGEATMLLRRDLSSRQVFDGLAKLQRTGRLVRSGPGRYSLHPDRIEA